MSKINIATECLILMGMCHRFDNIAKISVKLYMRDAHFDLARAYHSTKKRAEEAYILSALENIDRAIKII